MNSGSTPLWETLQEQIALPASGLKSHQKVCTETGLAPFNRESSQESEKHTFSPWRQNRTRRRDLHHSIGSRLKSLNIALPAPGPKSHQKACTETGFAPFDRESPQESENNTFSPWGQNRTRRHAQKRDLHHSIRNRFRSPHSALPAPRAKIAPEGTHRDGTCTIR